MWAHVVDGIVVEITDIDPDGRFHESLVWVKCSAPVRQRWLYDGSKFTAPSDQEEIADPIPAEISRRQFFQQLSVMEIISRQEALDAMQRGVIPAPLQAIIDQLPTEDNQFSAQMFVIGAQSFDRLHWLTEAVRLAMEWSNKQRDDFWQDAAKL